MYIISCVLATKTFRKKLIFDMIPFEPNKKAVFNKNGKIIYNNAYEKLCFIVFFSIM